MSVIQVGLADKTGELNPTLVQSVAAALNLQVIRDLPQFWNVQATVNYLPHPRHVPAGVWPVFLVKELPPGEGGVHLDRHNQPYAKVIASPDSDEWTIDASHETLEMLVDPWGNRMQSSTSIEIVKDGVEDGNSQFGYLVEACDPCEADEFGYPILGVQVSDFITPHYYDPVETTGTRYSFTGAIKRPRELLKGGYISFVDLDTDEWQQIVWVDPGPPQLRDLGPAQGRSLREWVDGVMRKNTKAGSFRPYERKPDKKLQEHRAKKREALFGIAEKRGASYR